MTFDSSLHEVCVRVGVRYVITKFSRMESLPNFLTHGAPQACASRGRELRYNHLGQISHTHTHKHKTHTSACALNTKTNKIKEVKDVEVKKKQRKAR